MKNELKNSFGVPGQGQARHACNAPEIGLSQAKSGEACHQCARIRPQSTKAGAARHQYALPDVFRPVFVVQDF